MNELAEIVIIRSGYAESIKKGGNTMNRHARGKEGTLIQAIQKRRLDRGLITEIRFTVQHPCGTKKEEVLWPIAMGVNAIAWADPAVEALHKTIAGLPPLETLWNGDNKPALMCVTDTTIFGLGYGAPERPSVTIMKLKILYPDGTGKERGFCSICNRVIAIAWTDDTVRILRDALVAPDREPSLEELWNGPDNWRDRPTLIQFLTDGRSRCGCWCLNCEMEGPCACGHC